MKLIARIAERTSGNPLLMEEMVRMLLDQGVLRPGTQGREVTPQWVEAVEQVPETVNGLILSRYDRLQDGKTTRRVHQEDVCLRRQMVVQSRRAHAPPPDRLSRSFNQSIAVRFAA